ncbi:MAG TPA: hypothetical protein VF765_04225, partial [Polyangiaceae bacterium]
NSANQAAASQNYAFNQGSHADNTTVAVAQQNSAAGSAYNNTAATQQTAASGQSAQSAGSNLSASTAANQNFASQTANTNSLQSSAAQQFSNAMVFNNLSYLNAQQFVLQVNATTTQQNNMLQLFQGWNNQISNWANFPISGCF